jgi:hypothetical protein
VGSTPLVLVLGLAFIAVSAPGIFEMLARLQLDLPYLAESLEWLDRATQRWTELSAEAEQRGLVRWAVVGSIYAAAAAIVMSALRALVLRSLAPFAMATLGLVGGLLIIPLTSWIAIATRWTIIAIAAIYRWIGAVVEWLQPALIVVGYIVLAAGSLFVLAMVVSAIWDHKHLWPAAVALIATGLLLVYSGWLEVAWNWMLPTLSAVAEIIAAVLSFCIRWGVFLFVVALIVSVLVGTLVGTVGTVGRSVYLSVESATSAGQDHSACADFAAAIGAIFSIMLTAAVLNAEFASWLEEIWQISFGLSSLPLPIEFYRALLPSSAESLLLDAFRNYSPLADAALAALVGGLATVSLAFTPRQAAESRDAKLVIPIMLAVGAAMAGALPIVALLLLSDIDSA